MRKFEPSSNFEFMETSPAAAAAYHTERTLFGFFALIMTFIGKYQIFFWSVSIITLAVREIVTHLASFLHFIATMDFSISVSPRSSFDVPPSGKCPETTDYVLSMTG